jgi:aquaglyceroporin related protein
MNVQVTICSAIFRGLPWKKVPLYIFGQVLGAFLGSLFVYSNYFHAIDLFEGGKGVRTVPGTASLFATYSVSSTPEELRTPIPDEPICLPYSGAIHARCELLL